MPGNAAPTSTPMRLTGDPSTDKGELTGQNPVDRGKPGSKLHVLCDRRGLPLAVLVSAANTHDSHLLLPLLDAYAPIRSRRGRPRHRPDKLHADKAYDQPVLRREGPRPGIGVRIARKRIGASTPLGRPPWVVQASLSWLLRNPPPR